MIRNILDNTTELYMIKYTFGEIVSSRGETLYKNPSDQTVLSFILPTYLPTRSYCKKTVKDKSTAMIKIGFL